MQTIRGLTYSLGLTLLLVTHLATASCPSDMTIYYCDSSAGRNVLTNGDYSSTYCTRHAVMNLQKLKGCCMWQGGVEKINEKGVVQCRDGSISEICTLQVPHDKVALY